MPVFPENSVLSDSKGLVRFSPQASSATIPTSQLGPFRMQGHGLQPYIPPLADPEGRSGFPEATVAE